MKRVKSIKKVKSIGKVVLFLTSAVLILAIIRSVISVTVVAKTEQLQLAEVLGAQGWEITAPQFLSEDTATAPSEDTTQDLRLSYIYNDQCSGEIQEVIVKGVVGQNIPYILNIDDEFHKEINTQNGEFKVSSQSKDSGVPWNCEDIKELMISITSSGESSEGEFPSLSWDIDTITVEVTFKLIDAEIVQAHYRWDTLAQNNNLTAIDQELYEIEAGQRAILYLDLQNYSKHDAPARSYAFQYASTNSTCDSNDLEWKPLTDTSELSYGSSPELPGEYLFDQNASGCGGTSCLFYISRVSEFGLLNSTIKEAESLQVALPIDTSNATPGTNYCIRTFSQNSDGFMEPLKDYLQTPQVSIRPAITLDAELSTVTDPSIELENEAFLANEDAKVELFIFEKATAGERKIDRVVNKKRMLTVEDFSIQATVTDPLGKEFENEGELSLLPDGSTTLVIPSSNDMKPGIYTLNVTLNEEGKDPILLTQDFLWGVGAINTDKDIYKPGDTAWIQMTVLDELGRTVCDASVDVEISTPSGSLTSYSTEDGTIEYSDECGPNNFTYVPDFSFYYPVGDELGDHTIRMVATTPNGVREFEQQFRNEDTPEYVISRSTATRIYPLRAYDVIISVYSEAGFTGEIIEKVPGTFDISNTDGTLSGSGDDIHIRWNVEIPAGGKVDLGYTYDAPDISPEFYLLGPLKVDSYYEKRSWQIASDAITDRYSVTCSGWTTPANAQGAPNLASTAGYSSFTTANSAYATVSARGTLTCSGFSNTNAGTFNSARVYFSLAADGATGGNDTTALRYEVNGGGATVLQTLTHNSQKSNSTNGGYWNYSAPNITSWTDVGNTVLTAVNARVAGADNRQIFIDAAWIEVDYTPATINISGTCKAYDRSTNCSGTPTVRYAVNGVLQPLSTTVASGTWQITGIDQPVSGDVITTYLSGVSDSLEAVNVTRYDGTGNITGVDLNAEHLTIGSDDNQTISNSQIANYDNSVSGNEDIFFDVDASNNLTVDQTAQSSQEVLYVRSGTTYQPASTGSVNVNTHDFISAGPVTLNANSLRPSGSIDVNTTLTSNTSTILMTATSGTESIDIPTANGSVNNLTIGLTSGSATFNLSTAIDINGALLIDYGTLAMNGSNNINLGGSLTINSNGNYSKSTGTFTFDGGTTQNWSDNRSTKADLGTVATATASTNLTLASSTSATSLSIGTSTTFTMGSSGYSFTLTGSGTAGSRPFIRTGTFTPGTNSTFIYAGTSATEVESTTYDNLSLQNPSGTNTFTLGTAASQTINVDGFTIGDGTNTTTADAETYDPTFNVSGNFLINTNGTYNASSTERLDIAGNYTNNGTFTDNTSTVTFDSTTTGRTLSGSMTGSSEFYKVVFNGAGGGWTITSPIDVVANTTGTFIVTQGTVTVGDGNGDQLTVIGGITVGSATGAATLQTPTGLAQGSTVTINVNTPTSPSSCSACFIRVGTTTDGDPTGTLSINKNGLLRFNSGSVAQSGVIVQASGRFLVTGSSDDSGTSTSGTNDSILYDTGKSWGSNIHQGKRLKVTSGYAKGSIVSISSNNTTSLTLTDQYTATDTAGSYNGTSKTFTTSTSFISATGDAIGQYLYNQTQAVYSRIVNTTESGSADVIEISDFPQLFAYTSGDTVTIVTGLKSADSYEIQDHAEISGAAGTSCTADNSTVYHGYIRGEASSEITISDSKICDLGVNGATQEGIYSTGVTIGGANQGFSITDSYIHSSYTGIYADTVTGVVVSNNTFADNNVSVRIETSPGASVSGNTITDSSDYGIYIDTSDRVQISSNSVNGNVSINSTASTLGRYSSNEVYGGTDGIRFLSSSNDNFVRSNTIYGGSGFGIEMNSTSRLRSFSNSIFGFGSGYYLHTSTDNIVTADQLGENDSNTQDVAMYNSAVSNISFYATDMYSTSEVSAITFSGSYILSEDHDPTTENALTRIWGEYAIPTNITETVTFNESVQQFNYANNLWPDMTSISSYTGTGTRDTDIQITLSGTITTTEWYFATVTTANGATPTFTITRTGGTATPTTYTLPGTYTESGTGVQFTIQDGATDYVVGDTYAFLVIPSSNHVNTVKVAQVMQSGDIFTVGTGTTLEMLATHTNETELQGPSGGFAFNITGTINANEYIVTRTDSAGMNLGTGATVTDIAGGEFDDIQGSTGSETYITVVASVLNATGGQTYSALRFDPDTTDANADFNITLTGTPSACTNSWTFDNASGNIFGESFDNDPDTICNGGDGYILWTNTGNNPPYDPASISQTTTGDVVIPVAEWTSGTSVKFTASASDLDATDTLSLCIEIDQLGTAFSNTENSCGTGVAFSGSPVTVTHTITGLTSGTQYHWQARVQDANTNYSGWVSFGSNLETQRDVGVDTSAPSAGTVYDGPTLLTDIDVNGGSLNSLQTSWTGFDDAQSGINRWEYAVGTTSGATDVLGWTEKVDEGDLYVDDLESGGLLNWDALQTDSGDLAISTTSAYTGLYSTGATIDDGNVIYMQDGFSSQTEVYVRFYMNVNNFTLGNNKDFLIYALQDTGTNRATILLRKTASGFFLIGSNSSPASSTADVAIATTGWIEVQLRWTAASATTISMWVNGTQYQTGTVNTSGQTVNQSKLGMLGNWTTGTGTLLYDDYSSGTIYQIPKNQLDTNISSSGHLRTGQMYYTSVRAINNATTAGTPASADGFSVLPIFSFSLNSSSICFLNLNAVNSWTDSQSIQTTASTNAYDGYTTYVYTTQPFTNTLAPTYTIPNYTGTNSAPTTWSGVGFGYTTSDNNLTGGTANRFTSGGPKYSGFLTVGPGEPVADHSTFITGTTGALVNQQFDVTMRVTANDGQAAGPYSTDIVFIAVPNF